MKSLLSIVLLLSTLSTSYADSSRTCAEIVAEKNAVLEHENRFATNDVGLTLFVGIPMSIIFPYALLFPATAVGFKIDAMIKVKNSRDVLAIYEEAANSGGKKTKKLFKKIQKAQPESQMTYIDFLNAINESNLNGEGCAAKKINKSEILRTIEIK